MNFFHPRSLPSLSQVGICSSFRQILSIIIYLLPSNYKITALKFQLLISSLNVCGFDSCHSFRVLCCLDQERLGYFEYCTSVQMYNHTIGSFKSGKLVCAKYSSSLASSQCIKFLILNC